MILSLILFAAILLIAYWWANAGAFSAFMHLLCVIFAGVLAFAVWEPLSYPMLTSGFGNYARGTVLLAAFLVLLVPMRIGMDRLIKENLAFPRSVDLAVGGAFGLASGVLTIGIYMIGAGMIQSSTEIFDFSGWTRRSDEPKAPSIGSDRAPILFVSNATEKWFAYLSGGSFAAMGPGSGTLDTHNPGAARMAGSLYRDSWEGNNGSQARVSLPPGAVSGVKLLDIPGVALSAGQGVAPQAAWGVRFSVSQEAFDGGGQQFIMSASQARLLGAGRNPVAAHPLAWTQGVKEGGNSTFFFNSPTAYATSVLSQGEGSFTLFFPKSEVGTQAPRFLELKGVRFALGAPSQADAGALAADSGGKVIEEPEATGIDSLIDFPDARYSIKGITINSNDASGIVLDSKNFIIGGEQKFPKGSGGGAGADLRVRGFFISDDQRMLRLDATATSDGVRIFPDLSKWVRDSGAVAQAARVFIADTSGAKYYAIGLVENDGSTVLVKSVGGKPLRLSDIPIQALGNGKSLALYFRVPPGTKLKGLGLSTGGEDRMVNTISNVTVPGSTG